MAQNNAQQMNVGLQVNEDPVLDQQGDNPFIQNINIGMVLTEDNIQHEAAVSSIVADLHQSSVPVPEMSIVPLFFMEGDMAWKEFFCPKTSTDKAIIIPAQWVDFFTAKLLSLDDFEWAKNILQSKL